MFVLRCRCNASFADAFALSGTLLLTLDTIFSVQVLTRYISKRYLSLIPSCHEGTWWTMTRKASFLIAALIRVVWFWFYRHLIYSNVHVCTVWLRSASSPYDRDSLCRRHEQLLYGIDLDRKHVSHILIDVINPFLSFVSTNMPWIAHWILSGISSLLHSSCIHAPLRQKLSWGENGFPLVIVHCCFSFPAVIRFWYVKLVQGAFQYACRKLWWAGSRAIYYKARTSITYKEEWSVEKARLITVRSKQEEAWKYV